MRNNFKNIKLILAEILFCFFNPYLCGLQYKNIEYYDSFFHHQSSHRACGARQQNTEVRTDCLYTI
jgi:hypothetical protein